MSAPRTLDPEQDRIDEEASAWVVLANDRPLSRDEQHELDQWLAADPRHEETWHELGGIWKKIPSLTGLASLAPLEEPATDKIRWTEWPRLVRMFPAMAFATAAAVVLAIFVVPGMWQTGPTQYATEIAQSRLLALPDGTQVTLGPRSRLTVKFSDGERRVALTGGEAFFEVVHDGGRPFLVEAGTSLIRVVGTKFDVNYGDGSVRVAVLEGVVQVSEPRSASSADHAIQTLRAGQRTEVVPATPAAVTVAQPLAALSAQAPGAWREGRLVYENMRLADLVADVNRYYAPGVSMADPAIGELRVTASFKASEIPAFLSALDGVVPVKAQEAANGAFRLESARN